MTDHLNTRFGRADPADVAEKRAALEQRGVVFSSYRGLWAYTRPVIFKGENGPRQQQHAFPNEADCVLFLHDFWFRVNGKD